MPQKWSQYWERGSKRGEGATEDVLFALLYKTISIGLRVLGLWYFPTLRSLVVSSSALFANSFLMRSAQFSLTFANSCHKREQNKNKNKQKEKKNNSNHKKVLFRTNFNYFLVVFCCCCCCGLFLGFYCIAGVAFKSVRCHALLAPTLTLTVCAKFEANIWMKVN